MNKIIEGAKEAVKVAQCDHAWESVKIAGNFHVAKCSRCGGTFYFPFGRASDANQQSTGK